MVNRTIIVNKSSGLHLRPAAVLAKAAETCTSKVEIQYKNHTINAKSLLNIVSVTISCGSRFLLSCTGDKEEEDLLKLVGVLEHLDCRILENV